MLKFNQNQSIVADNRVSLCDIEYMLTDDEVLKVKSIIDGIIAQRSSRTKVKATLSPTEEDLKPVRKNAPMVGKKMWQEDFLTVTVTDDKQYRLYITCPLGGEKGEKVRYAIKASAKKDFGATFAGDFDKGDIFWAFPTKAKADAFIKARKAYDKASK